MAFALRPRSFKTTSIPNDSFASKAQGAGSHPSGPEGHAGTQRRTFCSQDILLRHRLCSKIQSFFALKPCTKGYLEENTHCCKGTVRQAQTT